MKTLIPILLVFLFSINCANAANTDSLSYKIFYAAFIEQPQFETVEAQLLSIENSAEVSAEEKKWRLEFILRDEKNFHNGKEVDTNEVSRRLERDLEQRLHQKFYIHILQSRDGGCKWDLYKDFNEKEPFISYTVPRNADSISAQKVTYRYQHEGAKSAMIEPTKTPSPVDLFSYCYASRYLRLFKKFLSNVDGTPSTEKIINAVESGKIEKFTIHTWEGGTYEGLDVVNLDIMDSASTEPFFRMRMLKTNPAIMVDLCIKSSEGISKIESKDFRFFNNINQSLPMYRREVIIKDSKVVKENIIDIKEMNVSPAVKPNDFKFAPPLGYMIVDARTTPPIITPAEDVNTISNDIAKVSINAPVNAPIAVNVSPSPSGTPNANSEHKISGNKIQGNETNQQNIVSEKYTSRSLVLFCAILLFIISLAGGKIFAHTKYSYLNWILMGIIFVYLAIHNWNKEPLHVLLLIGGLCFIIIPIVRRFLKK
jgi:hypothetical protein